MAHVVRLVLLALLAVCSLASAAVQPSYTPWTNTWLPGETFTSADAACIAGARGPANISAYAPFRLGAIADQNATIQRGECFGKNGNLAYYVQRSKACPANSTASGSSCVCKATFVEEGGQCVQQCKAGEVRGSDGICKPKKSGVCGFLEGKSVPGLPRIEADYGKQSAAWAAGKIGKPGLVCTPEQCQATGTVTGCVAGQGEQGTTVCYVSEPKYTGESCTKDEKPGAGKDCPAGTKPSAVNPSICEPFSTTCTEGYEPSKYAEGVCIPKDPDDPSKDPLCEDPKDPKKKIPCEAKPNECPKGYVPSQYVKDVCIPAEDGEGKDKDGNPVKCTNGICVVKKPDGSTVEKPKTEFCAENPEHELCTKKSDSLFSGSCEASFTCKGDVLQCAIAQEQHRRNCQFFVLPTPESGVFENARAQQQEDVLSMTAQTVDLAAHINADPIITGSCPADMVIPVQGYDIRFPISQFCPYFNYLGLIVMVMTAVTCLRILGKD